MTQLVPRIETRSGRTLPPVELSPPQIIPDVAAYWVQSPQANPFPAVWPHGEELKTPPLLNRYLRAIDAGRIDTTVIVQKVAADNLANGFVPLPEGSYYEVVRYVRRNLEKVHETDYFVLYQ